MKVLKHIPAWLKNKYLLTAVIFTVWMFFFDPKDLAFDMEAHNHYRDLQKSELQMTDMINSTKAEQLQLRTDAETIEKYAREKYLMKKDNEDLFIVNSTYNAK